jgi:uncharacterized protein (TIGR02996 family)
MTQHDGFLRSIVAEPHDDAHRLVYADWLEDNGDPQRAEFIRVQLELEPMRDRYEIPRATELHKLEESLIHEHQKKWLDQMPKDWDDWRTGTSLSFRRGFPDTLATPAPTFLKQGPAILKLHPTIRRVVLFRLHGHGEQLAACAALEAVPELELACWYSDADARAVAASPHISQLRVLELWLGRQSGLLDTRLCRIMASSKAWPNLQQLTLTNPRSHQRRSHGPMVQRCDEAAGRKIATYQRGYPELFPFAEDFWYVFPGYLPDGRMALAAENPRTHPATLCVLTFDAQGRQTNEVLTVPIPDDLLAIPVESWYEHKDRMKQQLIDLIGFRPGFIRVRDCRFPGDNSNYNRPFWEDLDEHVGRPDTDADEDWFREQFPCGHGGEVWGHVRDGDWIFGWDRYADKRGRVHST